MLQRRFMFTVVILTILAGMGFILPAAPAAAASCGTACNGAYPQTYGCDQDARTDRAFYIRNSAGTIIGDVQLRESPSCGTNWARVTSWIGSVDMEIYIQRDDGKSYTDYAHYVTQAWGRMVYAPIRRSSACGRINFGQLYCTDWA
jgi:hypothetical protein